MRNCAKCLQKQKPKPNASSPMKVVHANMRMERIDIDILGPFPESLRGNRYVYYV